MTLSKPSDLSVSFVRDKHVHFLNEPTFTEYCKIKYIKVLRYILNVYSVVRLRETDRNLYDRFNK